PFLPLAIGRGRHRRSRRERLRPRDGDPHRPAAESETMTSSLLLGLIGDGISASRTPRMHEIEGAAHSISTIYRTIDIAEPRLAGGQLDDLLSAAIRHDFDGRYFHQPL